MFPPVGHYSGDHRSDGGEEDASRDAPEDQADKEPANDVGQGN